jgi:uncharacterized membrane protein YphA (DoxX/SURF4 family)
LSYLLLFCRLVIGFVFLASFVSKLRNIPAFMQTIRQFDLIPTRFSQPAALLLLGSELTIIVLILLDRAWLFVGFGLAFVLLVGFSVALASVLSRKIQTSCNCFGPSTTTVSRYDLWRNACFIACALGGCGTYLALNQGGLRIAVWETSLLGLVAAAFVGITTQFRDIAELLRQS